MKSIEIYRRYGIANLVPGIREALTSLVEERARQATDDVQFYPEEVFELLRSISFDWEDGRNEPHRHELIALAVAAIRWVERIDRAKITKE